MQSIWYDLDCDSVKIIDQTLLPHEFAIVELNTLSEVCDAICGMKVEEHRLLALRRPMASLPLAKKESG